MLIGALSHSGRFRAVFCEQMTFGHLAEAAHRIVVGLGGTSRVWRTDRMTTVVIPGTTIATTTRTRPMTKRSTRQTRKRVLTAETGFAAGVSEVGVASTSCRP